MPGQFFSDLTVLNRRTLYSAWRSLRRTHSWCGRLCVRAASPEIDVTVKRLAAEPGAGEHRIGAPTYGARRPPDGPLRQEPTPRRQSGPAHADRGMSVKDNTGALIGEVKALKAVATIKMGSDYLHRGFNKLGERLQGVATINASQAELKKMLPKK